MKQSAVDKEIERRRRLDDFQIHLPAMSNLLNEELTAAVSQHGSMASAHEGWAVIKEEFDELWDEIKKKRELRDPNVMRREALHVAAMACRFVIDVTMEGNPVK